MTARDALDAAIEADANRPGERLLRYETICAAHGACQRRALAPPGRWTWCVDCLTVFDDYGQAVNRIREMQ
jgi:hypothetical protein